MFGDLVVPQKQDALPVPLHCGVLSGSGPADAGRADDVAIVAVAVAGREKSDRGAIERPEAGDVRIASVSADGRS